MKLQWFQVQGYKNLRAPLRLEDLGQLNVVHGENNVGKSNLLESIGLFFVAIGALREEMRGGPSLAERYERRTKVIDPASVPAPVGGSPRWAIRSSEYFAQRGFSPDEIFDFNDPKPIVLKACLVLDRREGDSERVESPVIPLLQLERKGEDVMITFLELSTPANHAGFIDVAPSVDGMIDFLLDRLGPRVEGKATRPRFLLLRSDRTIAGDEEEVPLQARAPVPRALGALLLAAETGNRQLFERFAQLLECARDLVGPGTWRTVYDLNRDRAELALDPGPGSALIPLRLMGSGVQQIAVICAHLVMTGADVFAIEEAELNLRWANQRVFHDVLEAMSREPGSPQILLTSHSGAFEAGSSIYLLTRSASGPEVAKISAAAGLAFTQPTMVEPPPGARAPLSYVTVEGLVQIPAAVRENLGLMRGGGVAFVRDKDGHYFMLTDDQFIDLFEERGQEP